MALLHQDHEILEQSRHPLHVVVTVQGDLVAAHVDRDVRERTLDDLQHLVALAEQERHQVVAGNGDLDLGASHDEARLTAGPRPVDPLPPYARSVDDEPGAEAWEDAVGATDGLLTGRRRAWPLASTPGWLTRGSRAPPTRGREERWLRVAADADATFAGILLDLAERGVGIAVATVAERQLHGVVQVIGADFIGVRVSSGQEVLLALAAIASVRTAPAVGVSAGERVVTTDLRLSDVLEELAVERARVRLVVLDAKDAVTGELRSVGQDVVTVRTDGEAHGHRLRSHRSRGGGRAGLSDRSAGQPLDAVSG